MRSFYNLQKDNLHITIDPEKPHWFSGDEKASRLFTLWHEGASEADLVNNYGNLYQTEPLKAALLVKNFLSRLARTGLLERESSPPYSGRKDYLSLNGLKELWIHTNNNCNLACQHCLTDSSPREELGPDTEIIENWIASAAELGVDRFYFTGGEPFLRPDIFNLINAVTVEHNAELIILTNGTLFPADIADKLRDIPADKLKLQISIDGCTSKTNDAIRGEGSFERIVAGLKYLEVTDFERTLTPVVHPSNLGEIIDMPQLARELGVKSVHLMWPHLRGRFMAMNGTWTEQIPSLAELTLKILDNSRRCNVVLDNYESIKWRINGKPGVKFDFAGSGWESLCIYSNGTVYPSAAFAGHDPLAAGSLHEESLETIWRNSSSLKELRAVSLINVDGIKDDPLRFFLGGGDIEHAYFYSSNGQRGSLEAPDPYFQVYRALAEEAFFDISRNREQQNCSQAAGYDGPQIYHIMGEGSIIPISENENAEVLTLHSNCVLGFNVDKPRLGVSKFYGDAAEEPKAELCCPIRFDPSDVDHIPKDVIDRFYGCGSPVRDADIEPGETYMDLGSGAGIDCFIAARKVGPTGKVIGIDMTEQMLSVANENKPIVAENLGYDVVDFKKGYLEEIPVEPGSVDIVTSNCVINLSYDKRAVLKAIHQALRNGGRMVVSDIVAESDVPAALRVNPILWGECLSGSLTRNELFTFLEDAGFYGLEILKNSFWREAEGCKFYSLTFRAYKYEKLEDQLFEGHTATYLGPFKGITDEEGNYFPRNIPVGITLDTCNKFSVEGLSSSFLLTSTTSDEKKEKCACQKT